MADEETTTFDDPALKAALQRAFAGERAPAGLAERIRQNTAARAPLTPSIAATQHAAGIPRLTEADAIAMSQPPFRTLPFFGWLVAAMLLVGVGLVAFQWNPRTPTNNPAGALADGSVLPGESPIPQTLAAALVLRHDRCCAGGDHQKIDSPRTDFPRMERILHHDLKQRVLVADLAPDGWKFRGAAECPVAKLKSAHLIFDRDGASISVFSLPASVAGNLPNGTRISTMFDHHAIVGIISGGAMFCMVESEHKGTPGLRQLDDLFRDHEAESSVAWGERLQPSRTTVVELMYDQIHR